MSKLAYRTKGKSSPRGKSRVFFSCNPKDFERYFGTICDDIFKTQNCAIYYESDWKTPADVAELESQLREMQLFVVPITGNFLFHKSRALEMEYGFAMEKHIPVLPIVVEGGIENDFGECLNRIKPGYGDIQFISRVSRDDTEIPYSEKLERYLSSVLIGDELAERVRAAFDAYIFISYRKKDRQYAQELMRLIHRIPFCKDIATWYDEFLVPGEEWDKGIVEAMKKSICVAITVTPSLIEPDNFIIKREYPDAVSYGKTIIPAELLPTDMASLHRLFPGISDTIDGRNETELTEALKSALRGVALSSNKTPEHDYLIGLAYLGGVDVEKDTETAVRLIIEAANRGLPEAIGKLADMYQSGDGVNRDYEASAVWQEKLVDIYRDRYADDATEKNYNDFSSAIFGLQVKFYSLAKLERAKICLDEIIKTAKERYEVTHSDKYTRDLAISYSNLGNLLRGLGKPNEAMNAHEEALKIRKALAIETEAVEDRRYLTTSYNNLGVLLDDLGKPSMRKH